MLIYAYIKIVLLNLAGSGKARSIKNSYGSLYQQEKERKKGQDDGELEQQGEERENKKRPDYQVGCWLNKYDHTNAFKEILLNF